jgi:ATP-dependent DNA helicase DinG
LNDILQFFPLAEPRTKQVKCLEYIKAKIEAGFTDIVVAAPTGTGKSAIGVAAGFWIASHAPAHEIKRGAYYLVTQKLLQDQITNDIPRYNENCKNCVSIKTSEEYPCPDYMDCGTGIRVSNAASRISGLTPEQKNKVSPEALAKKTRRCSCLVENNCSYKMAKARWLGATLSITNYAFFFTSKLYTDDLKPRQLLICDEAHSVEEQIIRFIDGAVSLSQVKKWTQIATMPRFDKIAQYVEWVKNVYVPKLDVVYQEMTDLELLSEGDKVSKELVELDKYICKLKRAVQYLHENQENWVFWCDESQDGTEMQYIVRPVFGAPFARIFLNSLAPIRLYLSAYPGTNTVFRRSLAIQKEKLAWAGMKSDFPKERRLIHAYNFGSMGSASKVESIPHVCRAIVKIASKYPDDRGLIHCSSYELGNHIHQALENAGQLARLNFPKTADDRELAFKTHSETPSSILISPSMTEGYDFFGDKARWQIIAKVPYPYLGDKQIARKLELDPEWYQMRTIMSIIQACGRICRSSDDWGITYILDSDFKRLWAKTEYMIPDWFKEAVVFHNR